MAYCATTADATHIINGITSAGSNLIGCLQGVTTTAANYLQSTSTSGSGSLLTSVANQLLEGVFVFVRFILPYAVVIGLLIIGLGIVWRVFRGIGKV